MLPWNFSLRWNRDCVRMQASTVLRLGRTRTSIFASILRSSYGVRGRRTSDLSDTSSGEETIPSTSTTTGPTTLCGCLYAKLSRFDIGLTRTGPNNCQGWWIPNTGQSTRIKTPGKDPRPRLQRSPRRKFRRFLRSQRVLRKVWSGILRRRNSSLKLKSRVRVYGMFYCFFILIKHTL